MSLFAQSCDRCGKRTDGAPLCDGCKGNAQSCRVCPRPAVAHGYCAAHTGEAGRLVAQPWRGAYRDPEYVRNRALRLAMAHGECEGCHNPLLGGQWECHHVVSIRRWRRTDSVHQPSNLRILCLACHHARRRTRDLAHRPEGRPVRSRESRHA